MADDDVSTHSDPDPVVPLHELIRARMQQRGWSYTDLERASGRALTRGRWQQLGSGAPQRKFPDPRSLTVISQVLEIDITTVVLAAAQHLGLNVQRRGDGLSHLLPAGTDRLSERLRDAILTLIRAAVADTQAHAHTNGSGSAEPQSSVAAADQPGDLSLAPEAGHIA